MTQNKIIELAKQAGFLTHPKNTYIISKHASADEDLSDELEAFAKLVAEKEREACWDIIFDYASRDDITPEDESLLKHLADLIRARGQA